MAGRKSDFTLPTLDDLFSTQELRDDAKLSKIRDIPLELIDDFPDHPFKVRDDEDTTLLKELRILRKWQRKSKRCLSAIIFTSIRIPRKMFKCFERDF